MLFVLMCTGFCQCVIAATSAWAESAVAQVQTVYGRTHTKSHELPNYTRRESDKLIGSTGYPEAQAGIHTRPQAMLCSASLWEYIRLCHNR